jgi:hypothetical protein
MADGIGFEKSNELVDRVLELEKFCKANVCHESLIMAGLLALWVESVAKARTTELLDMLLPVAKNLATLKGKYTLDPETKELVQVN